MKSRRNLIVRLLGGTLVALAIGALPGPVMADKPACITVRKQVSFGRPGHNHDVILTSACKVAYRCHVVTNTNPKGVTAVVPAGKTVQVRTHLSSPSSDFTAKVDCTRVGAR